MPRDLLTSDGRRLQPLSGRVLSLETDDVLQALVTDAASVTEAPIAAVSLVLHNTQLFRAQVGMPAALAAVAATDRDVSFCQLVVRDRAAVTVTDAPTDSRVPQELVEQFGIRAYAGMPLTLSGEVVGTLCVIDTRARGFGADQLDRLRSLADRVTDRLSTLSQQGRRRFVDSTRPPLATAFARTRNLLLPLDANLSLAATLAVEVAACHRVLELPVDDEGARVASVMVRARRSISQLTEVIDEAIAAADDLREVVLALESAVVPDARRLTLESALDAALVLTSPDTGLVGGVRRPAMVPIASIDLDRAATLGVMTAAIVHTARWARDRECRSGLALEITLSPGVAELRIAVNAVDGPPLVELVEAVGPTPAGVEVRAASSGLVVRLPRV